MISHNELTSPLVRAAKHFDSSTVRMDIQMIIEWGPQLAPKKKIESIWCDKMRHSPETTEMVLRARSTRTVRMAVKLTMFGAMVMYL